MLVLSGGGLLLVFGRHLLPFGPPQNVKKPEPQVPLLVLAFQDDPNDKLVKAATMTFGLTLKDDSPNSSGKKKRLTLDERGRTNNTCYVIDKKEHLLGYEGGSWVTHGEDLGSDGDRARLGSKSVWLHQ